MSFVPAQAVFMRSSYCVGYHSKKKVVRLSVLPSGVDTAVGGAGRSAVIETGVLWHIFKMGSCCVSTRAETWPNTAREKRSKTPPTCATRS